MNTKKVALTVLLCASSSLAHQTDPENQAAPPSTSARAAYIVRKVVGGGITTSGAYVVWIGKQSGNLYTALYWGPFLMFVGALTLLAK